MLFSKIDKLKTGKYPFYSVDSTTWKSSERYGVTFVWDGKNFLQFDKTKKHVRKKYKRIMQKQGIDWKKLMLDDASENTKMALVAWRGCLDHLSDMYLRTGKSYWLEDKETLRKKAKEYADTPLETPESKLSPIYPPPEEKWEQSGEYDWEEVAKSMNINPLCDEETIVLTIIDILTACIHNDDEDYQEYLVDILSKNEGIVDYIYETFLEGRVDGDEEKNHIMLPSVFKEMVKDDELFEVDGDTMKFNDNNLTMLGAIYENASDIVHRKLNVFQTEASLDEDEDENELPAIPQEREVYAGDEYRNELALAERDENGRFKSGNQMALKKKTSILSEMPKLACDTCYLADNCPYFKPKSVCYYNKEVNKFDTRDMEDVVAMMADIANMGAQRLIMARIFEIQDGGMPDRTVTDLMNQQVNLLQTMKDLHRSSKGLDGAGNSIQVSASGETGNSILEKLFGNLGGEVPVEQRRDVTPEQRNPVDDILEGEFFEMDDLSTEEADDELAGLLDEEEGETKEEKPKKRRKKIKRRKKVIK